MGSVKGNILSPILRVALKPRTSGHRVTYLVASVLRTMIVIQEKALKKSYWSTGVLYWQARKSPQNGPEPLPQQDSCQDLLNDEETTYV